MELKSPNTVLYLPLYKHDTFRIKSSERFGHTCTNSGATWELSSTRFDGIDDGLVIPYHPALALTTEATILVWLKPNTLPAIKSLVAENTNGYFLGIYGTGKVSWGKSGVDEVQSIAVLSTGRWYRLVVTHMGGKNYIYLNGVLDNSGVGVDFAALTTSIGIGANFNGSSLYFDGWLREVQIINRALTPVEVHNDYIKDWWR